MSTHPSRIWPAVTAIVPTRQRPELLSRAIRSIVGQDYPGDLEILVVFDRQEPVDPGVDPGGRTIRLLSNGRTPGLAGSRNSGIVAARGDLIGFCDDDDEWMPTKLRAQVAALQDHEGLTVATTGIEIVHRDRTFTRLPPTSLITFADLIHSRVSALHPSTFLARKDRLLGGEGLVDEGIPGSYAEDYEWLLRLARSAPILAVGEPLVRVYWHESSWFAQRWQMIVQALTYLLERYPEFGRDPIGLARIQGQLAFASAAAGRHAEGRRWARLSLGNDWKQRRAYLALAVSIRLLSPRFVVRLANRTGRGI